MAGGGCAVRVLAREREHYDVHEVPYEKVYTWRPERIVLECDCGETLVWMEPPTAPAGPSTPTSRESAGDGRPTRSTPGPKSTRNGAGRGRQRTCDASTSVSSRRRAVTSRDETPHAGGLWYLIARNENNRLELLTLAATPHGEVLPVFGNEGAARDFLGGGGFGGAGGSGGRQRASWSRSCSVTWPMWRASPWIPAPGPPTPGCGARARRSS